MPKITGELCATCLSSISDLGYLGVTLNKRATINASVVASKLNGENFAQSYDASCGVFSLGSFFHGAEGHTLLFFQSQFFF